MKGRPPRLESRRREQQFRELVAAGTGLRTAARQARVKAERALDLVDDPGFWPSVYALRTHQPTATTAA